MPKETAHEVQCRTLSPGETLEGYGISPEEVIEYESATYMVEQDFRTQTEELLRVWYITETQVEVPDCYDCNSEKVYQKSKDKYVCPHCDI